MYYTTVFHTTVWTIESAHLRPSDDKASTWLQMVESLIVEIFCWHHSFNDLLLQNALLLLQWNVVVMLDGDDHCVHTQRNHSTILLLVVHSDLKLWKTFEVIISIDIGNVKDISCCMIWKWQNSKIDQRCSFLRAAQLVLLACSWDWRVYSRVLCPTGKSKDREPWMSCWGHFLSSIKRDRLMVTILLNSRHTYWPMCWFNEHSADKIAWSMSVRGFEPAHCGSKDSIISTCDCKCAKITSQYFLL